MHDFIQVNKRIERAGDVTQLINVIGKSPSEIETNFGFERGRLKFGWNLLFLCDDINIGDFAWGDTTERSGGRHTSVEEFNGEYFHPDIAGVVRSKMYRDSGWNAKEADRRYDAMQERQLTFLRDRTSPLRIIKVLPRVPHDPDKDWWVQYPDAPAGRGIMQWRLIRRKWFVVAANVKPAYAYLGGASGAAQIRPG